MRDNYDLLLGILPCVPHAPSMNAAWDRMDEDQIVLTPLLQL